MTTDHIPDAELMLYIYLYLEHINFTFKGGMNQQLK